jgi:xeroderma pigmentosum group C-complementing protein
VQEAGGFLNTADNVVQPYTLPRNLHETLPDTLVHDKFETQTVKNNWPDTQKNTERNLALVPVSTANAFDMMEEDEEPLEEVVIPDNNGTVAVVPKTMQELAEAAGHTRESIQDDQIEELPSVQQLARPATPQPVNARASTRGRSTRNGTNTPAGPKVVSNGTTSVKKTPAPRRGQKRARDESATDSDDERLRATAPAPVISTAAKRSRTAKAAAMPAVKSDRVLRSRKGKTETQLKEEREQEEAYRRAVAE